VQGYRFVLLEGVIFLFGRFLFPLLLFAVLGNPSGSTLRKSGGAEEK